MVLFIAGRNALRAVVASGTFCLSPGRNSLGRKSPAAHFLFLHTAYVHKGSRLNCFFAISNNRIAKLLQSGLPNLKTFPIWPSQSRNFCKSTIQMSELFPSGHVVAPFSPADWPVGVWVCRSHQR